MLTLAYSVNNSPARKRNSKNSAKRSPPPLSPWELSWAVRLASVRHERPRLAKMVEDMIDSFDPPPPHFSG